MGLLNKATKWRITFMKLFDIDNTNYIDKSFFHHVTVHCVSKGRKVIIIPQDVKIISTGCRIPQIEKDGKRFKYCIVCKLWLSVNSFVKQKKNPDGLKEKCSHCDNKQRRARYAKYRAVIQK